MQLMEHQKQGVEICLAQRATLLAYEVGVGKTLVAIKSFEPGKKNLVICPASLVKNWQAEIATWLGENHGYNIEVKSYNRLNIDDEAYCVVFDEAHCLKNPASRRSQYGAMLANEAKRLILLTATPVINRPDELLTLLRIMDVQLPPTIGITNAYDYLTSNNIMIRIRSEEVLHLPEAQYSQKQVELHDIGAILELQEQIRAIYSREDKDLDEIWDDYQMELVGLISKIRRHLGIAKITSALEAINEHLENSPDKPLIIFAHHKQVLETIAETFDAPLLYGKTGLSKRHKIVGEFQEGKHKLIVCSILAAGVGLTLTKSHHVIFVERDWTFSAYIQAVGRSLRKGQENEVQVLDLISSHPIDQRQTELLAQKRQISDILTDGNASMNIHVLQKTMIESILELQAL